MALLSPRYCTRAAKGIAYLAVFILLLFALARYPLAHLDLGARRYDTWPWASCPGLSPFDRECTAPRAEVAQTLQVVVKTGGTEPKSRVRYQLASLLSQVPRRNILIFSDLEEEVDSYHVQDVYADLSEEERAGYPEFALYDAQQEYVSKGKDTRKLKGGWDLAKYMNLAMTRKIWKMLQEAGEEHAPWQKWFVFIDTDTFIEWDNLLDLLARFDPEKKFYMGSPVWTEALEFAHGGSAYVLSYGALKAINSPTSHDKDRRFYSQYGLNVTGMCCGDDAIARVLKSRGIRLKGYWPMFNGEIPATVWYGKETWCKPVISLHHISDKNLQMLWHWTERWKVRTRSKHPLLFKDLYQYVASQLTDILEDWDNIEDGVKFYPRDKAASTSVENCRAACEADALCLQFVHDGTTCGLSHDFRFGRKSPPKGKGSRRVVSGWKVQRIRDRAARTECASAHWVNEMMGHLADAPLTSDYKLRGVWPSSRQSSSKSATVIGKTQSPR